VLGALGLDYVWAAMFLGLLAGALGVVVVASLSRRVRERSVPFAPFTALGTCVATAAGSYLR